MQLLFKARTELFSRISVIKQKVGKNRTDGVCRDDWRRESSRRYVTEQSDHLFNTGFIARRWQADGWNRCVRWAAKCGIDARAIWKKVKADKALHLLTSPSRTFVYDYWESILGRRLVVTTIVTIPVRCKIHCRDWSRTTQGGSESRRYYRTTGWMETKTPRVQLRSEAPTWN